MINIFESDIDKGNENINPFILRKLDDKYLKKFDDLEDNKNKINKKEKSHFY
jgi:hypothetical protein